MAISYNGGGSGSAATGAADSGSVSSPVSAVLQRIADDVAKASSDSAAAVVAAPSQPQAAALSAGIEPGADNPYVTKRHWDMLRAAIYKTPEDFGAFGDGSFGNPLLGHDDTKALNDGLTFCAAHGFAFMLTPMRCYKTSDVVQVGSGSKIVTMYCGVAGACSVDQPVSSTIYCTNPAMPGVNIQGARNVTVDGWYLTGDNAAPGTWGGEVSPRASDYLSPGISNTRWAPHCGISIDAFAGPQPVGGYAGKTYGQYTSSTVRIRGCNVRGFAVGIINWGSPGNGDDVVFDSCTTLANTVNFAVCQSQCRANTLDHCNQQFFHTGLDTRSYGAQNGAAAHVVGGQWVNGYRLFNITTAVENFECDKLYCESVASLGVIAGPLSAFFTGCFLFFGGAPTYNPLVHGRLAVSRANFTGCQFERGLNQNQNFLNLLSSTGGTTTFDSSTFRNDADPTARFEVCSRIRGGYGEVIQRNCSANFTNVYGSSTMNERSTVYAPANIVRISQATRWVGSHTGTTGGYLHDGEMNVRRGFRELAVPLSASGYTWDGPTLRFNAGVDGEFMIGDMLYWRAATAAEGGSPDADVSGFNGDIDGNIVALKVTAVAGRTVTALSQGDVTHLSKAYNPPAVYVAHNDWAATVPFSASWAAESNTATCNLAGLAVGDFVRATGLPSICRVTAIGVPTAASLTLSKQTLVQRTAEPIGCSTLMGL